jgi:signal peptidase I
MSNGERSNAIACISQHLSRRSRVWLRVQGSSMLPWVRAGDVAILREVSPHEVECGDIVLFARDSRFIVHRIVERRIRNGQSFLVTKGDANPHADGVIVPSEILGRVERIYRGDRRIDFHSREKRALGVLIARVSSRTRFWSALAQAYRITIRPARRLLGTLRLSRATAR